MAKAFFLVLRSLLVRGRASPMGVKVSKWSQSALLGIAVGLESAYSWFDLLCMARTLTFLHSVQKQMFHVSKNLVVSGRTISVGGMVSKWSQSTLLAIAVGLESM